MKTTLLCYGRRISDHRIRLAAGILSGILLFWLSRLLIGGDLKRALICAALSIGTGLFILLPEWDERINIPLILLYFYYVPLKLFQRTELPFHDMSRLFEGVQTISVWLIICLYLLMFLVTQKTNLALGIGNILYLILFLVEYYVCSFRGYMLTPNDILAAGTAATVLHNYDFLITGEGAYTVLYLIFFTAWGFRMKKKGGRVFHIALSAAALITAGTLFFLIMKSDYLEKRDITGHYWYMEENQELNGTVLTFFVIWKESRMEIPSDYSVKRVEEIAAAVQEEYSAQEGQPTQKGDTVFPHIIMIMNEAWSDLRVVGEIGTNEPFMPFADSLRENTIRGNLHVSILGGLTANTEFEALTGDTLALLSPTVIPYQNQVNHDIYALPRILQERGYQTMAMHPSGGGAWNRDTVYEHFGFEEFVTANDFQTEPEYLRDFISDKSNYQEIVWRFENRDRTKPLFLFDVTIQNHSGYYGDIELPIEVESLNGIAAEDAGYTYDLQTYLNLMKISDDDLAYLVQYFEQEEEPVILCIFGDHQPKLYDDFYTAMSAGSALPETEQNMKTYITPYIIWANYDIEETDYGDISANYLPGILMEIAGLDLPVYYQFTDKMRQEFPVLTVPGCIDGEGEIGLIEDWEGDASISDYRIMQYHHLYEENVLAWLYAEDLSR